MQHTDANLVHSVVQLTVQQKQLRRSLQVSPSKLIMPSRNDRLPSHTEAGVKVEAVSQRAEESASKYIRRIAAVTALICRWSRADFRKDMDLAILQVWR